MKKTFVDLVKEYSAWKLQEKGNGKLTREELTKLRESYKATTEKQSALKEKVEEYRAWKKENKGTDKITEKEFKALRESVIKESKKINNKEPQQNWETYLSNYKKFKEGKEGEGAKITYKELKMLKENWKEAREKGIHLKEGDPANAGFDPTGDPNAMPPVEGAVPGADMGMPDPAGGQTVSDMAAAISAAVQPFMADAGAMAPVGDPLGAPPAGTDAGPVTGMPPADPAAPLQSSEKRGDRSGRLFEQLTNDYKAWKKANKGTDKLTEAEVAALKEEAEKQSAPAPKSKYEQIKERIAARQAAIEELQENSMGPLPTAALANSKLWKHNKGNSTGETQKTAPAAPSQIEKVPSPQTLANGYSSGAAAGETSPAKTWPTKSMGKEAGGALQGANAKQMKENAEETETDLTQVKESVVDNSVKTVTDVYVDRYFEPKLDFGKLKESMKKGLLG